MSEHHHWWWDVPEFVRAQERDGFKAWVESISLGIDLYEIDFRKIIPGLPENDMFSDNAIVLAEQEFLKRYPSRESLSLDDPAAWDFIKYYGQAFVQKLECRWVWQPCVDPYWRSDGPAIEFPWPNDVLFDLFRIMTATVHRRSGTEWIYLFQNNRDDYVNWKADGGVRE